VLPGFEGRSISRADIYRSQSKLDIGASWPQEKTARELVNSLKAEASLPIEERDNRDDETSCGYFGLDHPVRILCFDMVHRESFERVISILVLINTAVLAAYDPMQEEDSVRNSTLKQSEAAFALIFTVEAVIKIIAWSFYNEEGTGYVQNPWNQLDFMCVGAGLVMFIPAADGANTLQNILEFFAYGRLLRPLRNLRSFQGIRYLVLTCLSATDLLADVFLLLLFLLVMFSVMALQMWCGKLGYRCYDESFGTVLESVNEAKAYAGHRVCSISGAHQCGARQVCLRSPNPGLGHINFDSMHGSLLTMFQVTPPLFLQPALTPMLCR